VSHRARHVFRVTIFHFPPPTRHSHHTHAMGNAQGWNCTHIGDHVKGKVAIVTGASSGLGLETARVLARYGAKVTLAVRNLAKTQPLVDQLHKDVTDAVVEIGIVDLTDLESVKEFARKFKETHDRLDILVNNAGIMG
jgi:NAD(P)-dependent dehydrogenase (short-subunit alcohol dehydrogenase family)